MYSLLALKKQQNSCYSTDRVYWKQKFNFFKDDLGGDASSDASPAFLSDCERDTECSECHSISLFH